ncbi:hypothetical protein [Planomonospora parontospora]|uniref:hypothetical protein n=1 Tax=Planomonospora parontospora TaxID=58119 RepID=UPI001670A1EC|nr:hypothetical protein [Planomonospora parontospora]GGL27822.1 hypothetical protein GCM10014719_31650 [Planomonospora parontospora subsp. antibiotica]GII16478.1 hypothetical protein Ppa05_32040 [Planomonospora parontospora subsp. antibiotica]
MNDEHDPAENPSTEPPPPDADGGPPPEGEDAPPTAPDAAVGESRTVAARSGADTDFPARPIPADPVEPSPPGEDTEDESRAPEPEDMGPSS